MASDRDPQLQFLRAPLVLDARTLNEILRLYQQVPHSRACFARICAERTRLRRQEPKTWPTKQSSDALVRLLSHALYVLLALEPSDSDESALRLRGVVVVTGREDDRLLEDIIVDSACRGRGLGLVRPTGRAATRAAACPPCVTWREQKMLNYLLAPERLGAANIELYCKWDLTPFYAKARRAGHRVCLTPSLPQAGFKLVRGSPDSDSKSYMRRVGAA